MEIDLVIEISAKKKNPNPLMSLHIIFGRIDITQSKALKYASLSKEECNQEYFLKQNMTIMSFHIPQLSNIYNTSTYIRCIPIW